MFNRRRRSLGAENQEGEEQGGGENEKEREGGGGDGGEKSQMIGREGQQDMRTLHSFTPYTLRWERIIRRNSCSLLT